MKLNQLLLVALLAACAGCHSAPPDTSAQDQNEIKALENRMTAAFKARDVNAIMALYTPGPDMVVFDMVIPLQYTGADAYRKDWQDFFAVYPGPADFSITNLDIAAGGAVAYSHSVQHASLTDEDGQEFEFTARVTDGYKKVNGHWLIAHEHVSVPVDFDTMEPDLNSTSPAVEKSRDYSQPLLSSSFLKVEPRSKSSYRSPDCGPTRDSASSQTASPLPAEGSSCSSHSTSAEPEKPRA